MSDLAERLRADADIIQRFGEERHGFINYEEIPKNAREAANEIERLQADKAAISETASYYLHEVERLQEALKQAKEVP